MCDNAEFRKLKNELFDEYFARLNPMQRRAVYTTQGPLLVLAGAGSGKTTVIVNRIANLILFGRASCEDPAPEKCAALVPVMREALASRDREKIREALEQCAVEPVFPFRILCITFTNKAADEFRERLYSTLGERALDIWAGTFHSICVRLLRRYIDRIGYKNDFTIYDADDSKRLVTNVLKDLNIAESAVSPRHALAMISRAKENGLTPADEAASAGRDPHARRIAEIYDSYQKRLRSANALDFDDIIMLTSALFDECPDVLEKCREMFRYILVDEYQDTNRSQSRLVAQLGAKHRNVCVVGDDDQSIYSFRGAVIDNILDFDIEYPDATVIRLEQNYRSTGNILKAANGIIGNNVGRRGKELWTAAPDGEKVHIKRVLTQADEAAFICDEIEKGLSQGAKYSDFAVLYRVNALSNSLETTFVKRKIPYRIFGGLRFYERREIKDILAYLSLIANPSDSVRLRRIINVPRRSIGDSTVDRIAELAGQDGISMFEVIGRCGSYPELRRASAKLERFAELIASLRAFSLENGVADTVAKVIDATGYRDMLFEEDDGVEREQNVMELISSAKSFEETAEEKTLTAFLNELALVSDLDSYDSRSDAVTLMTVHSAKGLEFGTVFVPGFEEGLFPSSQSTFEGDRGLEEERRLAYVAVTRAKKKLFLIHTSSRMLYGRTETRLASRFAGEIPPDCCERGVVKDRGGRASAPVGAYSARNYDSRQTFIENVRRSSAPPSSGAPRFAAGDRISHAIFGAGEIVAVTPMGGDVMYEINFDSGSTKRLMGNYAKLKKLDG